MPRDLSKDDPGYCVDENSLYIGAWQLWPRPKRSWTATEKLGISQRKVSHMKKSPTHCECEHESHFDGNDSHSYGEPILPLVIVLTPYGAFAVCERCAENHHNGRTIIDRVIR